MFFFHRCSYMIFHIFPHVVQKICIYIYIALYYAYIFLCISNRLSKNQHLHSDRRPCRHRRQSPDIAGRIGALAGPHPGQWVNITCVWNIRIIYIIYIYSINNVCMILCAYVYIICNIYIYIHIFIHMYAYHICIIFKISYIYIC